jgi:ABC-2 type transport system permease protein
MFNIFKKTLQEKKWTIIIFCLASILFIWMYVVLFPSIQESMGAINEYLKTLPESFMNAFGFEAETFGTFEGYIGGEQFSFIWPFMLLALMISYANAAIANETEKKTIGVLLAQPISRLKLFFGKFFAGVSGLIIFTVSTFLSVFLFAEIYNVSYHADRFWKLSGVALLFGLAIFGLSLLFSAIFSERSKVTFTVVGILVSMYVINIISGLKENLAKLKYLSFFHYFAPSEILVHNNIDVLSIWVFVLTFLLTTVLAVVWFNKRDVAV